MGNESAGGRYRANITMDTDIITGQHVLMQTLNQEGVSGFVNTPGVTTAGVKDTQAQHGDRSPRHVSHVTLNNMKFTTAFPIFTPQLGVRMDDGDFYQRKDNGAPQDGNTFVATTVDLPGIMQVNLGDHMHTIQLGNIGAVDANGTPGATDSGDVDAGQLFLSAENDLDVVVIAADVTGQFLPVIGLPVPILLPATEFVQLGDNTVNGPTGGALFPPSFGTGNISPPEVFTSGAVGTAAIDGNYTLTLGNNLNGGDANGWPVKQIETVLGHLAPTFLSGNLLDTFTTSTPAAPVGGPTPFTLPSSLPKLPGAGGLGDGSVDNADNGLALFLDPTIVQGDLRIFMGSGGVFHRESLVMNGVTAGNVFVTLASVFDPGTGVGDVPDGNPNLGVYVALDHVLVTDTIFGDFFDATPPGLTLTDTGTGADFISLGLIPGATAGFGFAGGAGPVGGDYLTVLDEMFVTLTASGLNTVEAHNTTCAFGIVDGGGGGSTYTDDGGNVGFFTTGLIG